MKKEVKPCSCCLGTGKEQDAEKLGREMRQKRQKLGMTLRKVAAGMGLSTSHVCYLEQGKRAWNPDLKQAYLMALKEV